ncbi:uncharacterized protein [Dendropsophus ebraccatus]|uniref:uncharacterized protein n=1 Tax=Dendropsophus ebraccatus TaxID=150705 RepID=UPI003832046C
MDNNQLRQTIRDFSLDDGPYGNQGYSRVLLQLIGGLGYGKSSFINSCKYVMDEGEEFRNIAGAIGGACAGTLVRKAHDLTGNITIVDNRNMYFTSFRNAEMYAQLGGFIPLDEPVRYSDNFTEMMRRVEDAELNPNYSDLIVPVLVYSCIGVCDADMQEMQEFMKNCMMMTGIFPIVVITNKTRGDFTEVIKKFCDMGAEDIIPVENYTEEDHIRSPERSRDILRVIHCALGDVRFRLEQPRNPWEDRVSRKKFLLEYIYRADLEKREHEWRIEEEKRRRQYRK